MLGFFLIFRFIDSNVVSIFCENNISRFSDLDGSNFEGSKFFLSISRCICFLL